MSEANTIWVKAYTPSGIQVGITVSFEAGKLMPASELDAMIASAGYLVTMPGAEPGQKVETITEVIRYTQHNSDGTTTPCIGLYLENPKLNFAKKAYLNTSDEQRQFEILSGLKIADLPEFPSAGLPKRNEKSASNFIKQVVTPFKIALDETSYTDDEGQPQIGTKFASFIGATPVKTEPGNVIQMPSGNVKITRDNVKIFVDYWKSQGIGGTQVVEILGVSRLSEYTGTIEEANQAVSRSIGA